MDEQGPSEKVAAAKQIVTDAAQIGQPHLFHTGARLREAIYGTIIMLSVLTVLSEQKTTPLHAILTLGGTAIVLCFAHVYAAAVSNRITSGHQVTRKDLTRLWEESWPIVAVTGLPLALLTLALLHVLKLGVALDLSILLGVISLGSWGWWAGHAGNGTWFKRVASAAWSLVVAMVIVSLKSAIH